MRRMSFALTKEQMINKTKTVTRRMGWTNLRPGDLVQPVEKCMGLKKGEKQVLIGRPIRVISNTPDNLQDIDDNELKLEGFPEMTHYDFIELFTKANKCHPCAMVNRIEFEFI